jgi:hypothetical protein
MGIFKINLSEIAHYAAVSAQVLTRLCRVEKVINAG